MKKALTDQQKGHSYLVILKILTESFFNSWDEIIQYPRICFLMEFFRNNNFENYLLRNNFKFITVGTSSVVTTTSPRFLHGMCTSHSHCLRFSKTHESKL